MWPLPRAPGTANGSWVGGARGGRQDTGWVHEDPIEAGKTFCGEESSCPLGTWGTLIPGAVLPGQRLPASRTQPFF